MRSLLTWAVALAACRTGGPQAPPSPAPAPTSVTAGGGGAARSLPTVLRRCPRSELPPGLLRCLAQGEVRAVIWLRSSTPDCSGVGHVRMVFDVLEARGARTPIRIARASQPLHARFGGGPRQPGRVHVAVLRPDRQPARRIFCVPIPATDASVTCAYPVDSLDEGRRALDEAERRGR